MCWLEAGRQAILGRQGLCEGDRQASRSTHVCCQVIFHIIFK